MDSLNPISSNNVASKSAENPSAKPVRVGDKTDASTEATPDVHVDISSELSAAESEAIMRAAKIKEMRDAIQEGRFPLDARKIAENFAELEKLL